MSTNIHNAWLIPTQNTDKLVKLANELEELWCKTYLQEHVKSVASWPWNMQGAALIKKEDPDFSACKDIARYALEPIIAIGETSVTWQMSSRESDMLEFLVAKRMKEKEISLSKAAVDALMQIFCDLYEAYGVSSHGAVFIRGAWHTTYMVCYGATDEMWNFLESRYEQFGYTDATDMEAESFPALRRMSWLLKRLPKKTQYAIASIAQTRRGKAWDAVFAKYGYSRMSKCGLKKDFVDDHFSWNVRKAVVEVLKKASDMKEEKSD